MNFTKKYIKYTFALSSNRCPIWIMHPLYKFEGPTPMTVHIPKNFMLLGIKMTGNISILYTIFKVIVERIIHVAFIRHFFPCLAFS